MRSEGPPREIRAQPGPARGIARGDADHRAHRFRGKGQTGVVAELADPDQRADPGVRPDRLRRFRVSARCAGAAAATGGKRQPDLPQGAVRGGARQNMTLARPLQSDRGRRAATGSSAARRRASPTRSKNGLRGRGRRVQHPAALFPGAFADLSIWWSPNCSAAASSAAPIGGRRCAITSASPGAGTARSDDAVGAA